MAFIETLKQRARQFRFAPLKPDVQQPAASRPISTYTYEPPEFIRQILERTRAFQVPQFTQERPTPVKPPLTEEKRKQTQKVIEFGKGVLRDIPRSAASLTLKATGQKEFVPGTGAAPKLEEFLFGKEPIKTPEETGKEMLRGFGVGEKDIRKFGGTVGYPLAILGAIPILPGKKKIVEEIAKEGTEAGMKTILKRSLKNVTEGEIDDLARKLAPITDKKIVQQELESFAKTKIGAKPLPSPGEPTPKLTAKTQGLKHEERGFITRVKETSPELQQRVHGQYVPRSTDRLAIKAKNLIKDDIVAAEKMARVGMDDDSVAVGSELINHYNNLAALAKIEADQIKFYDRAADIANELAPKLTEQGRAVQAAAIYGRLTPEGILRFSARQIQKYNEEIRKVPPLIRRIQRLPDELPQITGEQAKVLVEEARRIVAMPDGEAKALAFQQLQDKIAALTPTPLMRKIITVWKAGLLTGLKTSGLNIASNLFHGASEVVKDIPAAAVDSVASLFTGKRTTAFTVRGLRGGVKEGFEKGWQYFRTGLDERNVGAKLDYKRVHFGNSPVAKGFQKYEETIFRAIGAEDQPFYYGSKARSLQSQAIAQARNQKLRGEAAQKSIDDLVANPTDEMLKNAVTDAETAVFQQKTALGQAARTVQRLGGGAGEVVVPFGRTPSAVAMQILNYSPVGLVNAIGKAILAGRDFAQIQRQFSLAMGRGITGSTILGLGAWLYGKDKVSLGYPKDEREREQWELEGRAPNSIKIGDKWRQAQAFGPAGLMLMWGGYLRKFYEETGSQNAAADAFEAFLGSVGGMAKTFTEQTFVRGVESALGLLTDPERNWQRSVQVLAGPIGPSAIPTIFSDVAKATDPYQRNLGRGLRGIYLEGLMARIPGLRQQLQPRIDVAGQTVERPGGPIETMIDPTRPSRIKTSPAIAELARLSAAGYRVTPTDVGGRYGYKSLTPEQNTRLEQMAGQRLFRALDQLFTSEEYRELKDEEKEKVIQRYAEKARVSARAFLLKEILSGLNDDELKTRMRELKENKVLTKEVHKKLEEIWDQ